MEYCFVQHMDGTCCRSPIELSGFSSEKLATVITELAKFNIALSDSTFAGIGSLCRNGQVGPWANIHFCGLEPPYSPVRSRPAKSSTRLG